MCIIWSYDSSITTISQSENNERATFQQKIPTQTHKQEENNYRS